MDNVIESDKGQRASRERMVSESETESNSTSSSSSVQSRKRRRRRRDRRRVHKLEKLVGNIAREVRSLRDTLQANSDVLSIHAVDDLEATSPPSAPVAPEDEPNYPQVTDINFKLETTLKSVCATTSKEHADILDKLQHFNTANWAQVRYIDAQKTYVSSPGFTELDSNDMIKTFDRNRALAVTEKTLAAVSHALIIQNEKLKDGFEDLLSWLHAQTEPQTIAAVKDKINNIFSEGEYSRIHLDMLQMVCGRRADIIQQRRDGVLHFVKDQCLKESLRKIPPTQVHLFDDKRFSDCITSNGGIEKVFYSPRIPAQGNAAKRALAQRVSHTDPKRSYEHQRARVLPGPSTSAFAPPSQERKRKPGSFRATAAPSNKYYKNKHGKRSQRRYE